MRIWRRWGSSLSVPGARCYWQSQVRLKFPLTQVWIAICLHWEASSPSCERDKSFLSTFQSWTKAKEGCQTHQRWSPATWTAAPVGDCHESWMQMLPTATSGRWCTKRLSTPAQWNGAFVHSSDHHSLMCLFYTLKSAFERQSKPQSFYRQNLSNLWFKTSCRRQKRIFLILFDGGNLPFLCKLIVCIDQATFNKNVYHKWNCTVIQQWVKKWLKCEEWSIWGVF